MAVGNSSESIVDTGEMLKVTEEIQARLDNYSSQSPQELAQDVRRLALVATQLGQLAARMKDELATLASQVESADSAARGDDTATDLGFAVDRARGEADLDGTPDGISVANDPGSSTVGGAKGRGATAPAAGDNSAASQAFEDRFDGFDPYESWLGISGVTAQPNPYQLLGLIQFESSPDKINAGYQRARAKLQSVELAANQEHFAIVRAEVEEAKRLLTDRELRAELDAKIKRTEGAIVSQGAGAKNAPADQKIHCSCGQINSAQRVFCTSCGKNLWRICANCNSDRAMDEGHCGECGVNLEEAEAKLIGDCKTRIEEAVSHAMAHDYDRAITNIRRVMLIEDPRLHATIEAAKDVRVKIFDRRDRAYENREALIDKSKGKLADHNYADAAKLLGRIPEELRNDESSELLRNAERDLQLLTNAEERIRYLLSKKQLSDLAGPIEQVLALQPDHEQVSVLARQVRDKLCHFAQQRIDANDFDIAKEFLDCVPEPAVDDAVLALRDQLRDRSGLLDHLKSATVVSRNHIVAAEQLVKLTGSDEAKALLGQAEKAWDAGKRAPIVQWRRPPKQSAIGCPVGWQLYPRLTVADEAKQQFASQPARWFVATGLALQALGFGHRIVNFAPEQRGLFGKKKSADTAWGIDVGLHSIKLVRAKRDGETPIVEAVDIVKRQGGGGDAERLELLGRLRDKYDLPNANVAVAFGNRTANIRTTQLPPVESKKLAPILEREAGAIFPLGLADIEWRCDLGKFVDEDSAEAEQERHFGVFVAVKATAVENELSLWKETLRVQPTVLTVDALASRNAWLWGNEDAKNGSHALLDVGENSSVFSLEHRGQFWTRVLNIGGAHMTDVVTSQLKVTRDKAEKIKVDFSSVENIRPLFDSLHEAMNRVRTELERTFESIAKECEDIRCESLTCVGGGSLMTGLIDILRQKN